MRHRLSSDRAIQIGLLFLLVVSAFQVVWWIVEQLVVHLRKKFEPEPDRPVHCHTVRGIGYRFTPNGEAS